ncbi:hypothetical protein BUALT_Bualt14G0109400 [Buddleja alternifolia]|uniref:Uncharacterized protein n=1 Tax=Buddleja alternifolia TaxID=168488 RepID=A0AAV6WTQ3_9LAMI|nr:hypothetical protein BUALT_Bualt14G0109400 [Buddleja alternifolia]
MVAEPWMVKMGNQVSSNLKQALYFDNSSKLSNKKQGNQERQIIGILSFEVANVMSKIIHLHKSLTDIEISKLKNEIFNSMGTKTLVCNDEKELFELALIEKLDDLNRVASVVSRLGKKCTIAHLQGFNHVYGDIVSGVIDVKELGFLVKDMESMVRRMERYVNSTTRLYTEMEVMNELEIATKKFQQNHHEESRKAYEQKLMWQKQDVRDLKDVSLWNQTYDKAVELLARTVCTIFARMFVVFGDAHSRGEVCSGYVSRSLVGVSKVEKNGSLRKPGLNKNNGYCHSGPIENEGREKKIMNSKSKVGFHKNERGQFRPEDFHFACGIGPGRLFMECLSVRSSASKVDDDDDDRVSYDDQSSQMAGFVTAIRGDHKGNLGNSSKFGPNSRLLTYAPPNSIGGSGLALHYANIIIVLEKFLRYPHLVGDEARDDLYQMLPTSLRKTLKTNLKSYVKDLAIYDAPLAHDWRERLDSMLKWLAPLAHNMVRWQSERNFEQHQIVTRTNVLLLQTLYFADREKTEAAICEVLVGLNYICRYEQQQNALLDCTSSFDLEDCVEWHLQGRDLFGS